MKGFLIKILLFFLTLIITIAGTFGIVFMLSSHNARNLKIDDDIYTLICGDSHTKTALNDSIIPNSLNIAHSSEHYLYTYNVLKVLLKKNPQIRTVILGFSYHNISSFYDDYLFEQDKTQYMYPRYFTILDTEAMSLVLSKNFKGFLVDLKNTYHGVYRHINARELDDYSFIGWFYNSNRNNKNDSTVNRAIQEHYYNQEQDSQGFSSFQMIYLERIIDLCHREKVRLLLMNCPLSKEYLGRVPPKFIDSYNEFAEKHEAIMLDYHDFEVPEKCWGDGDHLNKSGAEIFNAYIEESMHDL